jgi:hypothetical protein
VEEQKRLEALKRAEEAERARQAEQDRLRALAASGGFSAVCHEWMQAAGIVDQAIAYRLIMAESGCNPNSVNPYSGACGIGQQLPCGKWPHQWNDPVGAMIDMQNYVFERYGSWANAWAFWNRTDCRPSCGHWY